MQKKERPMNDKKERTVEININTVVSVSLIVLMGVLLLFGSIHFIKSFIPANRFEVKGDTVYTASELAAGADIVRGEKLFRIDVSKAEKSIIENCPYVKDVNIRRTLFGKMKFYVECYDPVWFLEISGDYYVLDKDMRVLEETNNAQKLYEDGLILLTMPNVKSVIVGEMLEYGDGDVEIEQTEAIIDILTNSPAFDMVCSADIDNRYDLHFEFDKIITSDGEGEVSYSEIEDVFTVNVGGHTKLQTKLEYILKAMMNDKDLESAIGGTIDVTDEGDKVSIRPVYSQNDDN